MDHDHLFAFESDFVASLRCIPMAVRFKLDRVGVKLSLRQWSRLDTDDRRRLLVTPCATPGEIETYRQSLRALVLERAGEPAKDLPGDGLVPWQAVEHTSSGVNLFAAEVGAALLSDETWRGLADLQRFVLLKLSRDSHDNVNFVPALKEFGLYAPAQ